MTLMENVANVEKNFNIENVDLKTRLSDCKKFIHTKTEYEDPDLRYATIQRSRVESYIV